MSNEENIEEGVEILDPKMKAEQEAKVKYQEEKGAAMKAVNTMIVDFLDVVQKEHGMKLLIAGESEKWDSLGMWRTEGMRQIEEMGLSKLVETQI